MNGGRIHHAWVFAGPYGVGKFTTALAFASELLTPAGAERDRIRSLLRDGQHPDVHIITKELSRVSRDEGTRRAQQTNIPIEVVREFLVEPSERTRVLAGGSRMGKVFIVPEAELLWEQAQDTMLKTLEEPPEGTVLILVTSSEHELSPTIRSRSQRVAFTPLSDAAYTQWLGRSRLLEGAGLSSDDDAFLRRFAAGSPGVASTAVRTGLVGWWRTLGPALADLERGRFPLSIGQAMAEMADEWAKARVQENQRASKEAANRSAARWLLRIIGDHYRARLREAVSRDSEQAASKALRALDEIERAAFQADANVQLPFVLENLAAQLAT
jgi:DNA polymerase-3 subunit delta'